MGLSISKTRLWQLSLSPPRPLLNTLPHVNASPTLMGVFSGFSAFGSEVSGSCWACGEGHAPCQPYRSTSLIRNSPPP